MPRTYYDVLGVDPHATLSEIRRAYREGAKVLHPDTNPGANHDEFHLLVEAYEVLRDPLKRRTYDEMLATEKQTQQEQAAARWRYQRSQQPYTYERTQYRKPRYAQPEVTYDTKTKVKAGVVVGLFAAVLVVVAILVERQSAQNRLNHAYHLYSTGQYTTATMAAVQATGYVGHLKDRGYYLAGVIQLKGVGDYDMALELLGKSLKHCDSRPDSLRGQVHMRMAEAHLGKQQRQRAMSHYRSAAHSWPELDTAHLAMADLAKDMGQPADSVVGHLRRAFAIDPLRPGLSFRIGLQCFYNNQMKEAVPMLQHNLSHSQYRPAQSEYTLGMAHIYLEQREEGCLHLEKARELGFANVHIAGSSYCGWSEEDVAIGPAPKATSKAAR